MNPLTLAPTDEHDDIAERIHATAAKYASEEYTAVEALCLAFLVQMGEDAISDYMLVVQNDITGTTRRWLQRKDQPVVVPA